MSRITQVHRILEQKHLDAIIILSDYNRRYLSGFTGTSGALIISKDKQYLITDFRYISIKQLSRRQIMKLLIVNLLLLVRLKNCYTKKILKM